MFVDVTPGERELLTYDFVRYHDIWKGLELEKRHRSDWNLCWKRTGKKCTIHLISRVTEKTIILPDIFPVEPLVILRYSW
jgi:hypothetical protein